MLASCAGEGEGTRLNTTGRIYGEYRRREKENLTAAATTDIAQCTNYGGGD